MLQQYGQRLACTEHCQINFSFLSVSAHKHTQKK